MSIETTANARATGGMAARLRDRMPPWLWGLNHRAGRLVYADDDALSHHLLSAVKLRRIRAKAACRPDNEALFPPEQLREQGYVWIEDHYPQDLVDTIGRKVAAAFADPVKLATRQKPAPDGQQYSWYIKDLAGLVPEVRQLITGPLIAAMERYYGAHMSVHKVKCWRNLAVPPAVYAEHEIYSNHWHCDRARAPGLIKLFYLVHDTTAQQGPFSFQPRPRSHALFRKGFVSRQHHGLAEREMEHPDHVVRLVGRAGTIMIADTAGCLHRAGDVAPGQQRDLIQFQLLPATRPLPADWLADPSSTNFTAGELGKAADGEPHT